MRKQLKIIAYKDVATLSRILSRWGKIKLGSVNRLSSKDQRELSTAIKRARFLGLMPYVKR